MKILLFGMAFLLSLTSVAQINNQKTKKMEEKATKTDKDNSPKVTGIGGVFFFSENPAETRAWYHKNLGIETTEYGATFESRNALNPDEVNYLQWSPFKQGSAYFAPSKKEFMINYRVQNIEALVQQLRDNGVIVLDSIESYDYGKFVHILDADGHKLELWEPIDKRLTELDGATNK